MMRAIQMTVACVAVLVATVGQGRAGPIFNVLESGGNVNVTLSGSLDLNAVSNPPFIASGFNGYEPSGGNIAMGIGLTDTYNTNLTPWTSFGPGGFGNWDTSSGSAIALYGNPLLGVPIGYVSGSSLSGTATKLGETFVSLGFTPGSYTTILTNGQFTDTVTINIGQQPAVPEPSSIVLLFTGAIGLLGYGWRRKRKLAPATS